MFGFSALPRKRMVVVEVVMDGWVSEWMIGLEGLGGLSV